MTPLQQIIDQLKNLTEDSIPKLSDEIKIHSEIINAKLQSFQNLASLFSPVSKPIYARRYVSFLKAIFEARFTINNTLKICDEISTLASDLLQIQPRSERLKSRIKAEAEFCDNLIEDLAQFTDLITESLKHFSHIYASNDNFKNNFSSILREKNDVDFNVWCKFWVEYSSKADQYDESPLQVIINIMINKDAVINLQNRSVAMAVS